MSINEKAANWWAERFGIANKREQFKAALLKHLPDCDWSIYNDYDPESHLLDAVREVTECRGCMFSGDGLLPRKTGMFREGEKLMAKEGYGAPYLEVL